MNNSKSHIPSVAAIVDIPWGNGNPTMSNINDANDNLTISNINDTSVWAVSESNTASLQHSITESDGFTVLDKDAPVFPPTSVEPVKSLKERPIKTLFFGDSTIKNVNLLGSIGNRNECLKVARNNASINDLIETIEFFVDEVYGPNKITTVILQTCINDIKFGLTEAIVQAFENLMQVMEEKEISLIIVGPLPFPFFGSSAFSRACCINDQLKKHTAESENTKFVDVFNHFWNNGSQFGRNMNLNNTGQIVLAKLITEKCLLSTTANI